MSFLRLSGRQKRELVTWEESDLSHTHHHLLKHVMFVYLRYLATIKWLEIIVEVMSSCLDSNTLYRKKISVLTWPMHQSHSQTPCQSGNQTFYNIQWALFPGPTQLSFARGGAWEMRLVWRKGTRGGQRDPEKRRWCRNRIKKRQAYAEKGREGIKAGKEKGRERDRGIRRKERKETER